MALLKVDTEFNFHFIQKLIKIFPDLSGRFLSLVGKRGRTLLREKYLSGQELNLSAFPKDKKGKFTIVSNVNKRRTAVKIYSYPVNLFEKGRTLRDGRKEPGKFIITKKLKQDIMSKTGTYVNQFENKILNPELKKVGL